MAFDLVIDVENTPGALAEVAGAVSDAGVNLAAATCIGNGNRAELHILVPHPEPVRHALANAHLGISREREVVVVEVDDRPGVLAQIAGVFGDAGASIKSVVQRGTGERAQLTLIIHPLPRSQLNRALARIGELDFVRSAPRAINVIDEEFE